MNPEFTNLDLPISQVETEITQEAIAYADDNEEITHENDLAEIWEQTEVEAISLEYMDTGTVDAVDDENTPT